MWGEKESLLNYILRNYAPLKLPVWKLNILNTVKDIFMKLGTNIKKYQTMCWEQEL